MKTKTLNLILKKRQQKKLKQQGFRFLNIHIFQYPKQDWLQIQQFHFSPETPIFFTSTQVVTIITFFKNRKASGLDNNSNFILKCHEEAIPTSEKNFNRSVYSSVEKVVVTMPKHKKKTRSW